jgi:hypothetical protein
MKIVIVLLIIANIIQFIRILMLIRTIKELGSFVSSIEDVMSDIAKQGFIDGGRIDLTGGRVVK